MEDLTGQDDLLGDEVKGCLESGVQGNSGEDEVTGLIGEGRVIGLIGEGGVTGLTEEGRGTGGSGML